MAFDITTLTTEQQITALYVGYFGRAPDPIGLTIWEQQLALNIAEPNNPAGRSLSEIATLFSREKEATNEYAYFEKAYDGIPNNETRADVEKFINDVYLNLFDRPAEPGGLFNWTEKLINEELSVGEIILRIIEGAGPGDRVRVENKVEVGLDLVNSAIDEGISKYASVPGLGDLATTITDGVTSDPASVAAAKLSADLFFNEAPTLAAATAAATEDGPSVFVFLESLGDDADAGEDGSTLTYTVTGAPAEGTVAIDTNNGLTFAPGSDFQDLAVGETRDVTIEVTATDALGATAVNTVTVTVTGTNDAPVAVVGTNATNEDTIVTGSVSATDIDGGALTFSVQASGQPAGGTVSMASNGSYTFTPDADFTGDAIFTYTVSDGITTSTADVTVTVNPIDDAPVAPNVAGPVDEGSSIAGTIVATDIDSDDAAITYAADAAVPGFTLNADGSWTFDADNAAYNSLAAGDTQLVSTTYTATSGALTDSGTINITVTGTNDAPVATAAVGYDIAEDGQLSGQLQGSDVDAGDTLTFTIATGDGPSNGTLTIDPNTGAFTYTPNADFNGDDSFTYTVTDAAGESDTGTIDINIVPADDILTPGQDDLQGGQNDDVYLANENTLQTADAINGGEGNDTLNVSIGTPTNFFTDPNFFAAPTLVSVENVVVNAPNLTPFTNSIVLDLSNADGIQNLGTFQTTASNNVPSATVSFLDIQSVNNTNLEIIDSNLNHTYTYDSNAFVTLSGEPTPLVPGETKNDVVEITLQEVNGSTINLGLENAVPGTPGGDLRSHVDAVEITSNSRQQVNNTTNNYLQDFNVGPFFTHLTVKGDADFEIEQFLEGPTLRPGDTVIGGVNTVDASTLDADLTLDLIGQGQREADLGAKVGDTAFDVTGGGNPTNSDGTLTVLGSMGDNDIDVNGDTNGTFTFQGGNDLLEVGIVSDADDATPTDGVFGNLIIDMGEGNDTALLNITGVQDVMLGGGHDNLTINGNVDILGTRGFNDGVSQIDAGLGDDTVVLNGFVPVGWQQLLEDLDNDYNVMLGGGNDSLTVNGGGDNTVTGEAGNDAITINGNGNQNINSGADADDISVTGDGNQIIDSGEGADGVSITGFGFHNIMLGGGNDALSIVGGRLSQNNIDNALTDEMTNIDAGEGDDTLFIDGDHFLNVILGNGADSIELNADELTVDDVINGGPDGAADTEVDEVILNNNSGNAQDGFVGRSETSSITGVEVFDLRDENISLLLSSDNFDTALNRGITVQTTEASFTNIPQPFGIPGTLFQGMSRAEYEAAADAWAGFPGTTVAQEVASLNGWLLGQGVAEVSFFDGDNSGNGQSFDGVADPAYFNGGIFPSAPDGDSVSFQSGPTGFMLIDITDTPMSVASGRSFTLEGGNIQDIVVADDASISSRLTLNYDFTPNTLHSVEDTLQVVDGAQISAADLRNVNGLEIIELVSESNDAQTWGIELTDRVINQTTSNADLIIRVDPEVPAGTKVFIEVDPSVYSNTASKNVVIETVSNAEIYINGVLVTQPMYGTDLTPVANPTGATIMVMPRLLFTENTDNLVGTAADDTFTATSIDQIQFSDQADGQGGQDTLLLDGVPVSNPTRDLWDQLSNVGLSSIEEIIFETGTNVQFESLDDALSGNPLQNQLNTLRTGSGNDRLTEMETIGSNRAEGYFLNGGDDFFEGFNSFGPDGTDDEDYFVDGGLGDDTVAMSESDNLFGTDIETVELFTSNSSDSDGADADLRTVLGVDGDTMTVTGRGASTNNPNWTENDSDEETVTLSSEIRKASDGSLATVILNDIETLIDNGGDNILVMDSDRPGPDGDSRVFLNGGDDSLTATNMDDLEVTAGAGTKTVDVGGGILSNVNDLTYTGGVGINGGVDNIVATIDNNATINTGDLDDSVDVTSTASGTLDVDGGNGNDTLTARSDGGTVNVVGGDGDDTITATAATVTVDGGDGADGITVTTEVGETSRIDTGLGGTAAGDMVTLYTPGAVGDPNGGEDTIVVGDIEYDATQFIVQANTTQNFVQQGFKKGVNGEEIVGTTDSIDMISNFQMEAGGPGDEDIIDVSTFIAIRTVAGDNDPGTTVADFNYGDWTGGGQTAQTKVGSAGGTAEIAVIGVDNGFQLDASHIKLNSPSLDAGIYVGDNDARVVVAAYDTDNDGAYDTADLYLVQDVDQGAGQAWAVDKAMTFTFATEIGAISSIDDANFLVS